MHTLEHAFSFSALKTGDEYKTSGNAINPIPSWPVPDFAHRSNVSTSPPNDIQQYGAVDFTLWQHIGHEFLITSNINNWIVCEPDIGSLTTWTSGAIACHNVKTTVSECINVTYSDWTFTTHDWGFILDETDTNYGFFEGNTDPIASYYPFQNSCPEFASNHLLSEQPKWQIWLR